MKLSLIQALSIFRNCSEWHHHKKDLGKTTNFFEVLVQLSV